MLKFIEYIYIYAKKRKFFNNLFHYQFAKYCSFKKQENIFVNI